MSEIIEINNSGCAKPIQFDWDLQYVDETISRQLQALLNNMAWVCRKALTAI